MTLLLVHCLLILFQVQAGWLGLFDEKEDIDEGSLDRDGEKNAARTLTSFGDYSHRVSNDTPVNPLGRRDVEVSVKTGWPTTIFSPLCEAWSYLEAGASADNNSLSWKYLDVFADLGGREALDRWTDEPKDDSWGVHNSSLLALEVASKVVIGALDHNLLPLALSLRAHSPHCEMHRSLARDAAISFGLYNASEPGNLPDAFAIISKTGMDEVTNQTKVTAAQVVMDGVLVSTAIESLHSIGDSRHIVAGSKLILPLSDELVYPGSESDGDSFAVVYGHVGTSAFASMYQSFKESNIAFVVRHMGYIQFEEDSPTSSRAAPTKLQGYGVRLDIRNVEYKAFDDPDDGNDDSNVDLSDAGHDPSETSRDEYLAGVNLHRILQRLDADGSLPLDTDLNAMQTGIIQSHRAQQRSESIIPPAWQRRPLSMQATTIVLSSPDPLETLQGLSQNLPSIAHFLASVSVPPSLEKLAEDATALASRVGAVSPGWGDAAFGLYVNNYPVDVERPSFNVFQLLNVIREEDSKLRKLESRVRPVLKFASEYLGSSSDWRTLLAVRNALDMGMDKLKQVGKNSSGAKVDSGSYGDKEHPIFSKKYRIDVGRGGKNAVLYLNDIEKDPEYRSWPSSLQEMLMRSQYGGAPTVRRNLFTLLVVMDPASGVAQPSLSVAAQLMNSQVPLRIGVLLVNENDVLDGLASPHPSWNDGQRRFHARDASLILRFIAKEFGGLTSLSCLVQISQDISTDTDLTVSEYIDKHVAFLNEMGVIQGLGVRNTLEAIIKSGEIDSVTKRIDITYEKAVSFASDKLIAPGMSFFNGLPLPDASDRESFGSAVNEIYSYEQQNIMELAMKGKISDGPKSVYAAVLSKGDNLFNQFHPLLRESEGVYLALDSSELDSDMDSLLIPSSPSMSLEEVRALYLIEAVVDFESTEGVSAVIALLDISIAPPEAWYESKTAVAFKISPSGLVESPSARAMLNILRSVSQFNARDVKATMSSLLTGNFDSKSDVATVINQLEQVDNEVRRKLIAIASAEQTEATPSPRPDKNFVIANGRVFVPPKGSSISISDIEMLIDLEYDLSRAFSHLVLPKLVGETIVGGSIPPATYLAMGRASSVLFEMLSQPTSQVQDFASVFDSVDEDSPLFFSWNEESDNEHLQVKVSCILDPLTEPTQRVAPILIAIRDSLKIPLRLMLAPRLTVSTELPLSSYYRFVVDADSEDPKASFHNLPTNHLLTLRMDVPEIFDVQQSSAVEDADNLRCIPPYGCGDQAHLLAKGQVPNEGAQAGPTRIEYQLKNLLLFGQCHDLSKNTSPNGLQLTLDRSSIKSLSRPSAVEIDGKGVISSSPPSVSTGSHEEHADTLVMKTVGYWQLRANPGVWELTIAEHSRGAQIFDMVEGIATATGRLKLKRSDKMESKILSLKDFTNHGRVLTVLRKKGFEQTELFEENTLEIPEPQTRNETVHVFSLATGHAYERLLKIMMLSVTKRTSSPVKFWLFENFLSPSFKSSAKYMAEQIGCEVTFVTYKWPEWLRGQSEKQRLIWGYKILFLDVLFPLSVKKIIYVDADQVIRGDLTELANLDLDGAPYGYTPMCDSRVENRGYAFWRTGFWEAHLRGKPYHISALYVVDLERFRRELVGDKLRAIYQQLSADPNSLANLDQDLPNYAQHDVRIFSLPQKWLWCESWCSDETKVDAMTIDLCNNPEHKEAKITMAKRIISGPLFEESWEELDELVGHYDKEHLDSRKTK